MTSRQFKALRRRQASDAATRADRHIARHERMAAEADDAGLLNEAIYHAGKAEHWREQRALVACPQHHALARKARRAEQAAA